MKNKEKARYYYKKHGLLYVVYYEYVDYSGGLGAEIHIEIDSRWKSEKKAKKHCEILNSEL